MIDEIELITFILLLTTLYLILQNEERRRRWWVHPLNANRNETSVRNRVELMRQFPDRFKEYFRMSVETFDYILDEIRPTITRQTTVLRNPIDPETRLYITLHYLATGSSFRTIAFHYAVGKSTVAEIISDTCNAICYHLEKLFLKTPNSEPEWKQIATR